MINQKTESAFITLPLIIIPEVWVLSIHCYCSCSSTYRYLPSFEHYFQNIIVSIIIPSVSFFFVALPLAMVIIELDSLVTATNASTRGFTCLLCLLDILLITRERELWLDMIFCITIVSGSQYSLVDYGDATSIGHIQRVEGIFYH